MKNQPRMQVKKKKAKTKNNTTQRIRTAKFSGMPILKLTGVTNNNIEIVEQTELWVHYYNLKNKGWGIIAHVSFRDAIIEEFNRHGIGVQPWPTLPKDERYISAAIFIGLIAAGIPISALVWGPIWLGLLTTFAVPTTMFFLLASSQPKIMNFKLLGILAAMIVLTLLLGAFAFPDNQELFKAIFVILSCTVGVVMFNKLFPNIYEPNPEEYAEGKLVKYTSDALDSEEDLAIGDILDKPAKKKKKKATKERTGKQ